jgi:branched-chain amino acid transport system substrate-binding protein
MGTLPASNAAPQSNPPIQPGLKRLLKSPSVRIFNKFVVLPLVMGLIGFMIVGRVVNKLAGSKYYYVYVVGDDTDPSTSGLMNAACGGEKCGYSMGELGGVPVLTEKMSDYGDPERASSNAEELQRRSDVLMVVGHGSSTTSKGALPHYLQADPPIPVILTTDTNPALYAPPPRYEDWVPPVFRLFPTDDNQAERAAKFIADQHAKSVWVVQDTSNPTYSEYLARTFLTNVYKVEHPPKVLLWSNNLNLPPYAVDKLGIDWVFFAGNWQNALVLIRQLRAMPGTARAKVLLSDGCVDKSLLDYGGPDVEEVYLLHPIPADVFNDEEYRGVGEEAQKLAINMITSVHPNFDKWATAEAPLGYPLRKLLGLHRVSDARRALSHYMTIAVHGTYDLKFAKNGGNIMAQDDHRAVIRKDASFQIWRIEQKTFTPYPPKQDGPAGEGPQ